MKRLFAIIVSTGVMFWALSAAAATKDLANGEVITLAVHPAAAPQPALKYHLLPTFLEQVPGNAAPLYMKAFLLMADSKASNGDWDTVVKWIGLPVDKLPRAEAHKMLERFSGTLHQVELASRRTECDWGLPLRDEQNVFAIVLPEVQWSRNAARLLALRARLEIAEQKYDDAIHTLGVGYTLARHVAEAPLLVNGMVGIANSSLMNSQLEALVQAPGAPNLYWAVAALGDPFIRFDKALEVEASIIYLVFPELRDVETANRTPEEWQAAVKRVVDRIRSLTAGDAPQSDIDTLLTAAGLVVAVPRAKKDLVVRGWSEKEVDAMPAGKALLLNILGTFIECRDATFKWTYVPYAEGNAGMRAVEQRLIEGKQPGDLTSIFFRALPRLLLPAESRVCFAQAKSQRQLAALRCVEAIRMHAAAHEGKLPRSLSEVAEAPLPVNPVTGKAFPYRVEGDVAVLVADNPGDPIANQKTYRIRIVK